MITEDKQTKLKRLARLSSVNDMSQSKSNRRAEMRNGLA